MTRTEKLAALLESVVEKPQSAGAEWQSSDMPERVYSREEYLAHNGEGLRRVIVLLTGKVEVFKYSGEGKSLRTGTVEAPQVFGLYELLCGIDEHTATLQAVTQVHVAEVSPSLYKKALADNLQVAGLSLRLLAAFTDRMLNRTDQLTLQTPRENLFTYLYEACEGEPLPHIVRETKAGIAERLNINLRTLYRQLDALEEEGYLSRQRGKIVIDQGQYARLGNEMVTG